MRVLCCLDGTNVEALQRLVASMLTSTDLTIGLLYVIDTGPRREIGLMRERFFRPHDLPPARDEQLQQVELTAAQEILQEGTRYFPQAEALQRPGRPEREIVMCAATWNADLVAICPRSPDFTGPATGPKSVGHVARFVLDHAPCPVILARPVQTIFELPPPPPPPGKPKPRP